MEEKLEILIRQIIFEQYPSLYEVEVEDHMKEMESFAGTSYICRLKSDKCLEPKEQMEIDTEVKFLFSMLGPQTNSFRKPSIQCFLIVGKVMNFKALTGIIINNIFQTPILFKQVGFLFPFYIYILYR